MIHEGNIFLSQKSGEELLSEILGVMGRVALAADEDIKRIRAEAFEG